MEDAGRLEEKVNLIAFRKKIMKFRVIIFFKVELEDSEEISSFNLIKR